MAQLNPNDYQLMAVDDNLGMSNVIEGQSMKLEFTDTFLQISDLLVEHCGPFGQYAMLTNLNNQAAEPVFTKDGIGIVRALEYASPMQTVAKNTLAYMGARIETAAGDGTTTGMILLARGIAGLKEQLDKAEDLYTFADLNKAYQLFVHMVTEELKNNAFNANTLENMWNLQHVIRNIAYSQAYTSSHGNVELSNAVAELFAALPRQAWNCISIEKSKLENAKDYSIRKDDSQYSIQEIRIFPDTAATDDLGLSRRREHTPMLISSICPSSGGDVAGMELYQRIVDAINNDQELTVVCPRTIDNMTQMQLKAMFDNKPAASEKVCLFLISDDDPRLNDLICIKTLANKVELVAELPDCDYRYEKGELFITRGIHQETKSALNPMLGDSNYPAYNELVDHLDKIINQVKSEVSNRTLQTEIRRLQKFKMKLTVCRRSYFVIGGAALDNAMAVDVVMDAILATKHTLTHGFCLGGFKTLWWIMKLVRDRLDNTDQSAKIKWLYRQFADTLWIEIQTLHTQLVERFRPNVDTEVGDDYMLISTDLTKFTTALSWEDNLKGEAMTVSDTLAQKSAGMFNTHPLIIEPVDTDLEFIRRFGELALKYLYTTRIMVGGGLCRASINDKK